VSEPCPLCGRSMPPGAAIDRGCSAAARVRLVDVPRLLRELDITITRQAGRGDGGAGGDRLDFDEPAAAAAARLRGVLTRYIDTWARTTRIFAADAPRVATAMGTVHGQAGLLAALDLMTLHWAPQLAADLRGAVDDAWQRVDRPPDTSFVGWCLTDQCGRAVYARTDTGNATCPGCHATYDIAGSRALLLAAATHETADATTLGRALNIPPSTIRGWKRDGKLDQATLDGKPAYNPRGQPLYRVADVQALANGRVPTHVPTVPTPPPLDIPPPDVDDAAAAAATITPAKEPTP
jgi:hypothetical protein